jgi:hypothetical protein
MYKEYISILTVKSDKVQLKTPDIFSTNLYASYILMLVTIRIISPISINLHVSIHVEN